MKFKIGDVVKVVKLAPLFVHSDYAKNLMRIGRITDKRGKEQAVKFGNKNIYDHLSYENNEIRLATKKERERFEQLQMEEQI